MLTIVLLITLRVFVINVYNSVLSQLGKKRKRVLVFGMDEDSVMIATSPNRQVFMQNYSIIGFLTFGSAKKNLRIAELPVYQIEDIDDLLRLIPRNNLDGILFPNIKTVRRERDRLIHYCEQASLKPLVVPDMEEVHEGGMKRSVREIRIEAVSYTHLPDCPICSRQYLDTRSHSLSLRIKRRIAYSMTANYDPHNW